MLTQQLGDGVFVDHGGQWVSPGQDRIAELGVELFPSWDIRSRRARDHAA